MLDLWIFWAGSALYGLAVLAARLESRRESGRARSRRSIAGILLQTLGVALAGIGGVQLGLRPGDLRSLAAAALAALLLLGAAALFRWSSRTMGRNWSLVARTRAGHELVTTGPFALVRHPIYVSMLFFLIALAVATGHYLQLLWAIPVFAIGTRIRIIEEEKLLRVAFGSAFDVYARRTGAFFPKLR
ncbi:methyltransferase family protein [Sphingomonas horti]|nr:isoprenylcysteine carboxylmethyltransferase family protein [Sphingomonas horti]